MDKKLYTLISTLVSLVGGIIDAIMVYCASIGAVSSKAALITASIIAIVTPSINDILMLFVDRATKKKV